MDNENDARHDAEPGGNTNPQSQRAKWVFTWNNYSDEANTILKYFFEGYCKELGYGREVAPTTGTPHLQGYFHLSKKLRFDQVKKLLPKEINFRTMGGTIAQNKVYAVKDGDFTIWEKQGSPKGDPKVEILSTLRPWQDDIITLLLKEPNDRTINWVWDSKGNTGKTSLCKYLIIKMKAFYAYGDAKDVKCALAQSKDLPRIILIDIPRGGRIDYKLLEEIKNGLLFSGKYESKMIIMNSPHLVVFANRAPDTEKLSQDRWNIMEIEENKIKNNENSQPEYLMDI